MIVFVGDKPSSKNIDPNIPFVGTQSYRTLLEWIWKMDIDISNVMLYNKDSYSLRPGIQLGDECIRFISNRYVALGDKAYSKLLDIQEEMKKDRFWKGRSIKIFKLPHPSGRNRKLNDKVWVNEQLKECKKWLNR